MAAEDELITPRGDDVVEAHWPYDGPYSHYCSSSAAEAIARAVRYLNNATGKAAGLPYPATSYRVLTELAAATHGADQLLTQIHDRLELLDTAKAYDDRRSAAHPVAETIAEVAADLIEARETLAILAGQLSRAAAHASHLGLSD